nr:unnamed protein product [Digitaria exilis]
MAPSAAVPCLLSRRQAKPVPPPLHHAGPVADHVPPLLFHAFPISWLASPPPVLGRWPPTYLGFHGGAKQTLLVGSRNHWEGREEVEEGEAGRRATVKSTRERRGEERILAVRPDDPTAGVFLMTWLRSQARLPPTTGHSRARAMRTTTTMTLAPLTATLFLAVLLPIAAAGNGGRPRQGDYLNRLRGSPATPSVHVESSLAVASPSPAAADRAPAAVGRKEDDFVSQLPGQPSGVDFAQYAGYVTVDATAGRALFYYLAESTGGAAASASRPLVLWLNGGPGCSSLGYGAMEELGPFRVKSDGRTLYRNPYAWNEAANVLFLESPAGVGFSYSNTTADYGRSGDNKTADDALLFLLNWMEKFPEYKGRDFYLAGESYAGHYVPQLAHVILRHAAATAGKGSSPINLKGIMTDTKGMYDFFWTHALMSDQAAEGINKYCGNFSAAASNSDKCDSATSEADVDLNDIDIYNIYAPNCQSASLVSPPITPSRPP